MACEGYRETVLEVASNALARRRFADALAHVETCPSCRAALADFERIVAPLQISEPSFEPKSGWDAFDRRMSDLARRIRPPRLALRVGLPFSIATASLLAVAAFWVGQRSVSPSPSVLSVVAHATDPYALDPSAVLHATTAFAKVSHVFDDRAGWMLVSDSAATGSSGDLGLSPQAMEVDRTVDVLRLTMLQDGRVASSVDLVIVPGQSADLTVLMASGQSVRYRAGTSLGTDSQLRLLAEIRSPAGSGPLASLFTTLNAKIDGQLSVGQLETISGQFELRSAFLRTALPTRD